MVSSVLAKDKYNKPKYPYLGIESSSNKIIILFESIDSGTIISDKNNPSHPIGYYSDDWDESCFEPYDGTVILSNI